MTTPDVPALDAGLTLLRTPSARSVGFHHVAVEAVRDRDGTVYWADAANAASTYALYDLASPRELRGLYVARAFTAYQHHALVSRVVRRVDGRTGLVVAPNLTALYRDPDVPEYQRAWLVESTVRTLAALGQARDLPVLVSVPDGDGRGDGSERAADDLAAVVAEHADRELRCERTDLGFRYAGDGFETTVYRADGYWQTTIPYWVDLLGAVGHAAADGSATPQAASAPGPECAPDGPLAPFLEG